MRSSRARPPRRRRRAKRSSQASSPRARSAAQACALGLDVAVGALALRLDDCVEDALQLALELRRQHAAAPEHPRRLLHVLQRAGLVLVCGSGHGATIRRVSRGQVRQISSVTCGITGCSSEQPFECREDVARIGIAGVETSLIASAYQSQSSNVSGRAHRQRAKSNSPSRRLELTLYRHAREDPPLLGVAGCSRGTAPSDAWRISRETFPGLFASLRPPRSRPRRSGRLHDAIFIRP